MRVVSIVLYRVSIPLKITVRHASHTRDTSENVVVECRLDDGTTGFGECVPRDYVTGETVDTCLETLRRTAWSDCLDNVVDFGQAIEMISRIEAPPSPDDDRQCKGNAARCAVELALLDAYGKAFGESLAHLAGRLPCATEIVEPRSRCRYGAAITSQSLFREVALACKLSVARFRECKVKVGTNGQNDVRRLGMIRGILGRRVDLRVDANEAWSSNDVVDKIRALEAFGITGVEQPVPHDDVACLAEVRKAVATPIILDESVCSLEDARRAAAGGTCDMVNIRISKCGGLIRSIELAAFARRHGLGYQLGCQVGETGILSAAGRHFACSIGGIRYLEGSFDRYLVRERLTSQDLTFRFRGWADAITAPGLGVSIEPERLARVTRTREQIYG